MGGVLTMVENVCELHTPNISTEIPTEAFKNNSLDLNYLYSWVWFNHWERFIKRWQNILVERGYIEEKFIEMLSTVTPGNDDSIDRQNLQNLLESTVGTEDDNFGDELKIFDE